MPELPPLQSHEVRPGRRPLDHRPGERLTVRVGSQAIGGGSFALIAGPCAVESRAQLLSVARAVRDAGADLLRGGAFKPRTSPYAFQGLGRPALPLLAEARELTGMPIVTELIDVREAGVVGEIADVVQIGARNMQSAHLLREAAWLGKPILLKRNPAATIDELLAAADYLLSEGNEQVMLCERGIRTFESSTRYTLDVAAVPVLRARTHLPIIVDPSHAAGRADLVAALAAAALGAGADGVMIEVHGSPQDALSDGAQSITCEAFADLAERLRRLHSAAVTSGVPAPSRVERNDLSPRTPTPLLPSLN